MRQRFNFLVREGARAVDREPPFLLLLHGYGMFQEQFFTKIDGFDERLTIYSLQAPFRIGPGAYRWFDFEMTPEGLPSIDRLEEARSRRFLTEFIEELRHRSRCAPLYLFGHSQGGMMAMSIALTRPELIDGCAVANSRVLPSALAVAVDDARIRSLPFLVRHGIDDDVIPIERGGRRTLRILQAIGASVDYREYRSGHAVSPAMLNDVNAWSRRACSRHCDASIPLETSTVSL